MRKLAAGTVAILMLLFLSRLTHSESWVNGMFSGRQSEVQFVHEQVTDISWILLLCTFSLLVRFRKRRGVRLYLMAAAFLLFTLAALHSHPLWSSSHTIAADSWQYTDRLTRISNASCAVTETGLRLDDVVSSMAFDPDGNLWLSTPSNGPYCYLVHANEVENLLRPDVIYGLSPDPQGMWVMASRGAFLYHGPAVVREVRFPSAVIPLTALAVNGRHLFGTTRGLFSVAKGESVARLELHADRITLLHKLQNGVLLAGDSGLWRWTEQKIAPCLQIRYSSLSGLIGAGNRILAPTGGEGIVTLSPRPLHNIRFAQPELNIVSPGAAVIHRGKPCFGTYAGAVIYQEGAQWKKARVGEYPVSSLASDGSTLYAWSGGQLLAVHL